MANILLSWSSAQGGMPPPPYGADYYRVYVWYRGQRKPSLDCIESGTSHLFMELPGGEYTFRVYSQHEAETSQAYASDSIVVSGTQVAPEGGDAPPDGNPDIAAPEEATAEEA